jgi:hypothetical protein
VIHRYHAAGTSGRREVTRQSRRRRLVPAAAVAVVLLGAIVAGSGMGPALANSSLISPVVAGLLRIMGLSPSQDRVTPLAVSATSAGQTISVLAGYADSTRTVTVLQVSPSGAEPVAPTLTDGSGSALPSASVAPGPQGHMILSFGPLGHPSPGPNSLTLRIDTLRDFAAGKGAGGAVKQVSGEWVLHFSLPYENDALPTPPPGQLGRVTVTFTFVAASSTSVHVRFVTAGATLNDLFDLPSIQPSCDAGGRCAAPPPPGGAPFLYQLLDPTGRPVGDMVNGNPSGKGEGQEGSVRVEWETLYARGAPGTYHLVMTWNGNRLERDIQVR